MIAMQIRDNQRLTCLFSENSTSRFTSFFFLFFLRLCHRRLRRLPLRCRQAAHSAHSRRSRKALLLAPSILFVCLLRNGGENCQTYAKARWSFLGFQENIHVASSAEGGESGESLLQRTWSAIATSNALDYLSQMSTKQQT